MYMFFFLFWFWPYCNKEMKMLKFRCMRVGFIPFDMVLNTFLYTCLAILYLLLLFDPPPEPLLPRVSREVSRDNWHSSLSWKAVVVGNENRLPAHPRKLLIDSKEITIIITCKPMSYLLFKI